MILVNLFLTLKFSISLMIYHYVILNLNLIINQFSKDILKFIKCLDITSTNILFKNL